jgi:hypothetical protein
VPSPGSITHPLTLATATSPNAELPRTSAGMGVAGAKKVGKLTTVRPGGLVVAAIDGILSAPIAVSACA